MAHNVRGRTTSRPQRSYSTNSDSLYTPRASPPHNIRRTGAGARAARGDTVESDVLREATVPVTRIPAHYTFPPTVPSPYTGTLEASLDAVLGWGEQHPITPCVLNALLQPVDPSTNWPLLLRSLYIDGEAENRSRSLLESFLFLVTRTLLPNQITENRDAMARLYNRKKQLAIRVVLRYDMLREWKMDHTWHPMAVASVAPKEPRAPDPVDSAQLVRDGGRPFLPNIISTLIAAPPGGWTTHAVRERMKHHITGLDNCLLLTDAKVASWDDENLLGIASQAALQWQWLRQNNEILEQMEVHGYERLEGKADECEWIADDVKRGEWGKVGGKKGMVGFDDHEE